MKCEKCPAFDCDGCYYPVEYCEIGTLSDPVSKDDGCELHYRTINKVLRESREAMWEAILTEVVF